MFNIVERGSAALPHPRHAGGSAGKRDTAAVPGGRGELTAAIREFCYPQTTHPALENVNFRLKPGQMLGICGPTGAGKSTILSLIQRHFDVTQERSDSMTCC